MTHQACMKRNVFLLQAHAAFLNMIFVLSVIVPYYRDFKGLNFQQFMIGEALMSFVIMIMEVPTGWLADAWTRRSVIALGTLSNILGWAILWLAHSFLFVLLAQAIIGVALCLISGTASAMLYESLIEIGEENDFRRHIGKLQGVSFYAMGITAALGGLLYSWHPQIPVIATWATSIPALALVIFMREPHRHQPVAAKHPLKDMIETMRYALQGHRDIAIIIFFSSLLFAITRVMFRTQQPYFMLAGIKPEYFGLLSAAGMIMGGIGGHASHFITGKNTGLTVLKMCFVFTFFACLLSGMWIGSVGAVLLLIGSVVWGVGFPGMQEVLNQHSPDARRATILSTASFMVHVFSIPLIIITGYVTEQFGVKGNLLSLATLVVISGLALGISMSRHNRKTA